MSKSPPPVQLFPTCLVDQLYPRVGRAVVRVLESLGFQVQVPQKLVCCGQPAYNSGSWKEARKVSRYALQILDQTEGPIIIPSGSCADMIIHQTRSLFDAEADSSLAQRVADRSQEFSAFVAQHRPTNPASKSFTSSMQTLTYHPSCHLSRGLGVQNEPLEILDSVPQFRRIPLPDAENCCGFGGMFSVKQADISSAMMNAKIDAAQDSGADCLVSCDLGCLLHLEGGMRRRGVKMKAKHLAEILSPESSPDETSPDKTKDAS